MSHLFHLTTFRLNYFTLFIFCCSNSFCFYSFILFRCVHFSFPVLCLNYVFYVLLLLQFVSQTSSLPSILFRIFHSTCVFHFNLLSFLFLFSIHYFPTPTMPYILFIFLMCLSATLHFLHSLLLNLGPPFCFLLQCLFSFIFNFTLLPFPVI
jgi:hypothetical protein